MNLLCFPETVRDMVITPLYQQHASHTLASQAYGLQPHIRRACLTQAPAVSGAYIDGHAALDPVRLMMITYFEYDWNLNRPGDPAASRRRGEQAGARRQAEQGRGRQQAGTLRTHGWLRASCSMLCVPSAGLYLHRPTWFSPRCLPPAPLLLALPNDSHRFRQTVKGSERTVKCSASTVKCSESTVKGSASTTKGLVTADLPAVDCVDSLLPQSRRRSCVTFPPSPPPRPPPVRPTYARSSPLTILAPHNARSRQRPPRTIIAPQRSRQRPPHTRNRGVLWPKNFSRSQRRSAMASSSWRVACGSCKLNRGAAGPGDAGTGRVHAWLRGGLRAADHPLRPRRRQHARSGRPNV